jgi:pimeloyl-ACP methyl ester carboxylesterase
MGRTILGVVAGMLVCVAVIMGIEALGHLAWPPPPGLDPSRPEDVAALVADAPAGAMALVVLAWVLGSFAGGFVAAKVARQRPRLAAVLVSALVLAGVVAMIVAIPQHPYWMSALGLLLPVPAALLGAALARPRIRPSA